jgi:signal transduction histidine kinase
MAGKIVHDLKGPITVLSGYAELLEGAVGRLAPDDVGRYARTMREAGGRLQDLVTELLEYARGRSVALRPEPWALPRLFDALVACVEPLVLAGQRRLATVRPGGGAVLVDRARIERVVLNLAKNALEAIGPRGEVRLSAGVDGDRAWIEVGDDGPGVPRELRERLFDPFVTSGKDGGTGLGLAIAQNLAEAHGGRLTLLDRSPGAHFRIELPLEREN